MRRRDFLRAGALVWAATAIGRSGRAQPSTEPVGGPIAISTWDFGRRANRMAHGMLAAGKSVVDAAERGVMVIEGDPKITSVGYGGLPNAEGVVQLDAAIMDGQTLEAGSVAGLQEIMHPVAVARKVMDETVHVMLVGEGARAFALQHGFRKQDLLTPEAKRAWEKRRAQLSEMVPEGHDTCGIVTMDADGRMAAACTTSGAAWKLPGRVGDSPLIGHGLYCDTRAGGAVATGAGEEVIKVCGSYQVVEFMRQGVAPDEAVRRVLQRILRRDPVNNNRQVGLLALRADGQVGYGSLTPGFEVSVSRGGKHETHPAPSLVGG